MQQHPFEQKLYSGECTHQEIQQWLINRYSFEVTMMQKDCIILANSDDHAFRKVWLKRVIDSQSPGGGLDQWREMCTSAGILPEDIATPGAKLACENYINWCKNTHWKIVVSASLSQIQASLNHEQKTLTWPSFYPNINWSYFSLRKDQAREDSQRCLEFIKEWNLPQTVIDEALKLKRQLMTEILI